MASNLSDQMRGLPASAGDLVDALESLEERFARIEGALGEVVSVLDEYPGKLGAHFDERIRQAQEDLILAEKTRDELIELMADPDLGPTFKDHPARTDMLLAGWVRGGEEGVSLRDVAARLKAEVFDSLTDAGVPEARAEKVAETVADKIEGATGAGDERAAQEAKDREGVMKHSGKVGRGLLTRLAGGPGARDVEHGGIAKVKTSRAGSSSDFRRPGDRDWNKA